MHPPSSVCLSGRPASFAFSLHIFMYRVFIKYCVSSKNSWKFATSSSPELGCYWLYKKLLANRSDCTLALRWELWRSLTAMLAREGLQWIVKKHIFSWTPWTARPSLRAQGDKRLRDKIILSFHRYLKKRVSTCRGRRLLASLSTGWILWLDIHTNWSIYFMHIDPTTWYFSGRRGH